MNRYFLGRLAGVILLLGGAFIAEGYSERTGLRGVGTAMMAAGALWAIYVTKNRKHLQ